MLSETIVFGRALKMDAADQALYWRFVDSSTSTLLRADGTTHFELIAGGVYDGDGNQRDIEDLTRIIGKDPGGTLDNPVDQKPTVDQEGAVTSVNGRTGGVGYFYYNLDLTKPGLPESTPDKPWYARIFWAFNGTTRMLRVNFYPRIRKDLTGLSIVRFTPYVYCTPHDVLKLLKLNKNRLYLEAVKRGDFDMDELIRSILEYEVQHDTWKKTSYRIRFRTDEVKDFEAWRQRYPELFGGAWFAVPRPLHLEYGPLLPIDPARRHRIELFDGHSHMEGMDPVSRWNQYLTEKNQEGRELGRWMDWNRAILYIRKSFLFRRGSAVRITYEYGKPITKTTRTLFRDDCEFVPVESTWQYQNVGVIRIEDEYIIHNGATADGFYNLVRGAFGTAKVDHPPCCEVYEVPDDIRGLVAKRVAADFISTEPFNAYLGDGPNTAANWGELAAAWKQEWEDKVVNIGSWSEM